MVPLWIPIASLCVALVSVSILLLNEYRRRRDRPFFNLEFSAFGTMEKEGETWHLVDVVNAGTAAVIKIGVQWNGIELRDRSDSLDGSPALRVPPAMRPGDHVQIAVRGDLGSAWVRYTGLIPGGKRLWVAWEPLRLSGTAAERWLALADEDDERSTLWRKPWRWRPGRLPEFRHRDRPVGPYPGGEHAGRVRMRTVDGVRVSNAYTLYGVNVEVAEGVARPDQGPPYLI